MSIILTISREYGSGGREIAERLSEYYNDIPVFDRKLIDMTADRCGFSSKFIQANEERMTNSFLFNIAVGGAYSPFCHTGDVEAVPQDYVFLTQSQIITTLAKEHPSAIFVGRCADYILRENPNLFSVFITADMEFRVKRTAEELGIAPEKAASVVVKHDKARRRHYNYYTGADWGERSNYHMVLNTGKLGLGAATDILKEMIQYAQA